MKPTHRAFLLVSSLLAAATAHAQTWTGGATDDLWTSAANWTGGTPSTSTSGTSTVTFYNTGTTDFNTFTGGRYNLNAITFNSTATSPVTINVGAGASDFSTGTSIRFNAGTNITVNAGDHKIVGTGVTNDTIYDVIFAGGTNSTHTFNIASGASFEINARIHQGSGTLTTKNYAKTGGGTLILSGQNGGGGAWQIHTTKAFEVQQGVLRFTTGNAGGNSANNFTVSNGAAFELTGGFTQTVNNGNYTLNGNGISSGGALRSLSGNNIIAASNTSTGTIALATNSSIGVDADTLTIRKVVSGTGSLTKVGAGTLVLDNTYSNGGTFNNTYSGGTRISAGVLGFANNSLGSSGSITVNGGTLRWQTGNTQDVSARLTLENSGSAILDTIGNNVTLATGFGGNTSSSLTKTGAGTLTLSGNNTYTGSTSIDGGTLALSGTGSISSSPLIQINTSTTLSVTGVTGGFTVGASQTVGGNGTILATSKTVTANGTLSPGNSPGTLTQDGGTLQLGIGGDLNWQVHNVDGAAGTGYDTVSLINGATLDLSLLSAVNQYNINLWSLSAIGPDANGNAINFDNTQSYTWTLFSTGTAISDFDASYFNIFVGANNGASGFSNALGGGSFSVGLADSNTDLVLNFSPIPEPRAALLGGLGMLLLLRRRRG